MTFRDLYVFFTFGRRTFTWSLHPLRDNKLRMDWEETDMADFWFLALTLLFFVVALGYTFGCDKL